MSRTRARTLVALALQAAALLVLALALLGASWLDPRTRPRMLLLVDRSPNMPAAAADRAAAAVIEAAKARGATLLRIDFAGRPAPSSTTAEAASATTASAPTNIEAALQLALAEHARAAIDRAVIVSNGFATAGDTERGLRAVRAAGLALQWIALGRPPPETRIAEVLAPDRATAGQRARIAVRLAGQTGRPLRVDATARSVDGDTQIATAQTEGRDGVAIEFDARGSSALVVDVALIDPASGQTVDARADAAVVALAPPAAILYAHGSTAARAALAPSLARGGWKIELVPAANLDGLAGQLDAYQAVVLDDVAIADAGGRFWGALAAAVRDRGVGLLALGGERSFARGGYSGSTLESVLPVDSAPAALDQPVSIVFAVDKSGSMGRGSGGVDRFALAQRAVIESARDLGARDALGLLVFDVDARMLIPLGPAAAAMPALERGWPVRPGGGTRIEPALDAAIDALERSGSARRMLVLVTDGFVGDAPLAQLRDRLDRARIETIAIAVGPDADAAALQRIVGAGAGTVLRVDEAAQLPVAMRSGIERRRTRVERGTIAVRQTDPLPFTPSTFAGWPAVASYAVTRARANAVVAVQSERGEPLIAYRRSGRGRVAAVTCGLGAWTPQWLAWREWSRLAGGLAGWVSGESAGGAGPLAITDTPEGVEIEADSDRGAADLGAVSIAVATPAHPALAALPADPYAPGRVRATLPDAGPGVYTVAMTTARGATQTRLHLRRQRADDERWGTNPQIDVWRRAGLIGDWDPAHATRHRAAAGTDHRPLDRSLVGLSLALFLCGVLVDRVRLSLRALARKIRRVLRLR